MLLKESAQKYFNERLEFYQTKINEHPNHITLSNAKTKWGSCSSSKNIKLSWRLIHAKPEIIDYVLCHELAHLKHMNHSILFWKEVESIFPEYKTFKKELKDHSLSYFILD
jgi:predicted metal-dependent hydrolase